MIGFPADLSTDWAYYDSPMEEGAQFAVDQINEEGGVLGRPLELQTVDMRNDVAEAAKVTQQLIDDGAVYLIGTVGDGILAEGQVACATGVPISTGLGTAPSLVGDMGECAYQLVMSDNIQAAVLAEYAIAEGYETAYVLGSNEIPYTRTCRSSSPTRSRTAAARWSAPTSTSSAPATTPRSSRRSRTSTPRPTRSSRRCTSPTAWCSCGSSVRPGSRCPVLSTDGNADAGVARCRRQGDRRTDVLELGVHGRGRPRTCRPFYDDYNAANGKDPSSYVAVIGYDEVNLVADAIEAAGSTEPAAIIEQLATRSTAPASRAMS